MFKQKDANYVVLTIDNHFQRQRKATKPQILRRIVARSFTSISGRTLRSSWYKTIDLRTCSKLEWLVLAHVGAITAIFGIIPVFLCIYSRSSPMDSTKPSSTNNHLCHLSPRWLHTHYSSTPLLPRTPLAQRYQAKYFPLSMEGKTNTSAAL